MTFDEYTRQIISRVEAYRAGKDAQAMEARSAREAALEAAVNAMRDLAQAEEVDNAT